MTDFENRVACTEGAFRRQAQAWGAALSADDRVPESVAAALCGYQTRSFQNLRALGCGPAYYTRPLGDSRSSYRLRDLALWIEQALEEGL